VARSYELISGDTHLQIPADMWTHRIPERYREFAPRRIRMADGGDIILSANGNAYWGAHGNIAGLTPEQYDPNPPLDYDETIGAGGPEQRLKEQDADGIEGELIYLGGSVGLGPLRDIPEPGAHSAMIRAYNDYLAEEYCGYAPDRLWGVGILPRGSIDEKIAEMEHCKKIGLKVIDVAVYPAGKTYPMPEDDRFWAASLDLEMPITIHTAIAHYTDGTPPLFDYPTKIQGPQKGGDYLSHLGRYYGWSRSGGVDAVQMVVAGLFERFPKLRIYWGENQIGWVPFMYEQLDFEYEKNHVWAERLHGLPKLAQKPSETLREHAYWGFYEDRAGIELRHLINVDRIIWGSDFPHFPSRWPESRKMLARQMEGVPEDQRKKILAQNLIDFLHLDGVVEKAPAL
jgi:uncharacterized protein